MSSILLEKINRGTQRHYNTSQDLEDIDKGEDERLRMFRHIQRYDTILELQQVERDRQSRRAVSLMSKLRKFSGSLLSVCYLEERKSDIKNTCMPVPQGERNNSNRAMRWLRGESTALISSKANICGSE